jgi:hypothetical protein
LSADWATEGLDGSVTGTVGSLFRENILSLDSSIFGCV